MCDQALRARSREKPTHAAGHDRVGGCVGRRGATARVGVVEVLDVLAGGGDLRVDGVDRESEDERAVDHDEASSKIVSATEVPTGSVKKAPMERRTL